MFSCPFFRYLFSFDFVFFFLKKSLSLHTFVNLTINCCCCCFYCTKKILCVYYVSHLNSTNLKNLLYECVCVFPYFFSFLLLLLLLYSFVLSVLLFVIVCAHDLCYSFTAGRLCVELIEENYRKWFVNMSVCLYICAQTVITSLYLFSLRSWAIKERKLAN